MSDEPDGWNNEPSEGSQEPGGASHESSGSSYEPNAPSYESHRPSYEPSRVPEQGSFGYEASRANYEPNVVSYGANKVIEEPNAGEQRSYSGLFLALLGLAIVAAIAGLGWTYYLSGRLTNAEMQLSKAQQQNQKLASALDETNARLKVTSETLGHSLGITQKQLEERAQDLLNRQQAAARHFESEQEATQQKISSVSNDVSGVKNDVGGVKTNLSNTQTELKTDEVQLQSMKGDLGVDGGLIATNAKELEILKHKGDRNYYEFTLYKGQKRPISTVSLELKKADVKHSRYTLIVYADDKKIEKKDRGLNEPVQFYTGKDNYLYELVVNSIDKNEVKGYIATPKSAPVPVSTTGN